MSGNRQRIKLPQGNVARGLFRLARGDAGGLREFGNTPEAFYGSIAPLLAFPLVGSVLFGLQGHWRLAALVLASRLSGVLLQPVITEFWASRADRRPAWLLTSTALNWSLWLIFPLIAIAVLIANGLLTIGVGEHGSIDAALALIGLYFVWFQWFVVKAGLRLKPIPAACLVIVMNVAIALLYLEPYLLHPDLLSLTLHPTAK